MNGEHQNGNVTDNATQVEQALRTSELSYRRLFETAQDGILILDADTGRVNDVNPFLIKLLGFARGEMIGKTVGELSPFKDVVSNQAMLALLQKDGYVRYHDLPLETKDGRKVDVEFVSNVYSVGDAQVIQCNIREITDRKRAEVALHAAQQFLVEVVNAIPVRVFWKDKNLVYLGCNTVFARDAGFAGPKDIIGKKDGQMVWREQAEAYREDDRKIIESGQSKLVYEETQTTPEGKTNTVLSSKLPLRDARGEIIGVLGTYMDITARKQMELEHQRMVAIVEATTDFVGFSDLDGRVLYYNRAAREHLGIGVDEDVTKSIIANYVFNPENNVTLTEGVPAAIRDGQWSGETMLLGRSGRKTTVSQVILSHKNTAGKVDFLSTIMRDITERKRVQESHDRLAMAVEQADETVVITDTNGTILYANPAFEKTTGYTRAEALGQNPRLLKSGEQDDAFYRQMWKVLDHGDVWHGHFINKRKDGTLYEENATISPMRDAAGKTVNFVAVKRDVTREVQLEAQFRQSQKMDAIGKLAGGVAHDFNNILAVIQMQADLLKSEAGITSAQSETAVEIGKAVQRASALTRQLLLFSRKQMLQLRDLDLNESINEMTKMLRRTLGEDIQLQFKFAMQDTFVHADAGMMDQVLMNLAVNARDAMPKGGQLIIETSAVDLDKAAAARILHARPGSFVCLSVTDTGCGISAENVPRIFEPFFTTKDVGKGTGLGLATVFGIVQLHLGWVEFQSQVGHGTTFRIYLPRLASMSEKKPEAPVLAAMRGGVETILLVEDDVALCASVRKVLSQLGYCVLEAVNGIEALKVWELYRDGIHLLLTDVVMPGGMSGIDLGERLLKKNPKLKVIYNSGYSAEVAGKDFPLKDGINFLTKPFQANKLAQTVRQMLDKPA